MRRQTEIEKQGGGWEDVWEREERGSIGERASVCVCVWLWLRQKRRE